MAERRNPLRFTWPAGGRIMHVMFKEVSQVCASPIRLKVATFFVRRAGEWGSVSDVASVLSASRAGVQKELQFLKRLGILKTRRAQKITLFSVNDRHPLYVTLAQFMADTLVPNDRAIARLFRSVRGVSLVVVAGLLTQEPKSSVDVLVVSRAKDQKHVERALKKVEALAALPLRYAILEIGEYKERRQAYDRMLRDVFEYEHRVILEKAPY